MKKFLTVNFLTLCGVFACATLTPTERAILDDAASRALNAELNKIGPAPVPVKAQK